MSVLGYVFTNLLDLWILRDDGLPPGSMRLFGVGPQKVFQRYGPTHVESPSIVGYNIVDNRRLSVRRAESINSRV